MVNQVALKNCYYHASESLSSLASLMKSIMRARPATGEGEAGRRSGVCGKAVHEIAGARAHFAPSHSSQLSFIDDGSEHVSWVVSRASLAPSTGLRISALCTAS